MKTVGSFEAKTHLARLLEEVSQGETITITRHGKPVAQLVPVNMPPRPEVEEVIRKLRLFRSRHPLGGLTLRELIDEGRQF